MVELSGLGPWECEVPEPPQYWNGWECPRFTKETAEHIAKRMVATPDVSITSWRWDGDTLITVEEEPHHDGDIDEDHWRPDPEGRYHLGSWSWTWQETPELE